MYFDISNLHLDCVLLPCHVTTLENHANFWADVWGKILSNFLAKQLTARQTSKEYSYWWVLKGKAYLILFDKNVFDKSYFDSVTEGVKKNPKI